ncbi:MAG: TRL-like family protein [Candidatus Kapabacteria bacterium]|nr:TRL-like family protein [Candidatus Kapabacteria bacterium]
MKKILMYLSVILLSSSLMVGCAAYAVSPVLGGLYTDVKAPITATSNTSYSKMGSASASSILGLIAVGDASINTAAKNGGITRIHHVDYKSTSILGIYATYTVYVYGE